MISTQTHDVRRALGLERGIGAEADLAYRTILAKQVVEVSAGDVVVARRKCGRDQSSRPSPRTARPTHRLRTTSTRCALASPEARFIVSTSWCSGRCGMCVLESCPAGPFPLEPGGPRWWQSIKCHPRNAAIAEHCLGTRSCLSKIQNVAVDSTAIQTPCFPRLEDGDEVLDPVLGILRYAFGDLRMRRKQKVSPATGPAPIRPPTQVRFRISCSLSLTKL